MARRKKLDALVGSGDLYGHMSGPERDWVQSGHLLLVEEYGEDWYIEAILYEPITFRLPGATYTPDFLVCLLHGTLAGVRKSVFVETKEEYAYTKRTVKDDGTLQARTVRHRQQSYRDSRSKLRAAASVNPWYDFWMATRDAKTHAWNLEKIEQPDYWDTAVFLPGSREVGD